MQYRWFAVKYKKDGPQKMWDSSELRAYRNKNVVVLCKCSELE